jgi:hypothetical protein
MKLARLLFALGILFSTFSARPAAAQGLLTCNLPPLGTNCSTTLAPGQDTIQLSVHVGVPTAAGNDTARVTVSSSHCCVRPQVATADRNGYVNLTWRAAEPPDTTVTIALVQRDPVTNVSRTGVVGLFLPKDRPIRTIGYLDRTQTYVWVRGDHVPVEVPISVLSVGWAKDSIAGSGDTIRTPPAMTRELCESVRFAFLPRMEGKASPDTGRATWHSLETDPDHQCRVETRWQLADDAGEQNMEIHLGGDNGIQSTRFPIRAFARQTPRLSGGFGYFQDLRQDREVSCGDEPEHPRCAGKPDSVDVTVQVRNGAFVPFFGLEFPIFFGYRPRDGVSTYLSERLRIVLGSTFERPEDNFFVGLTLMPLISGASEASPFQLSMGLGRKGLRTWYMGMSLDASTIVAPILSTFGVTGAK